jgi:hypothetical protein
MDGEKPLLRGGGRSPVRTVLRPLTGKKSGKNNVLGEVISQKTNDWRGFRPTQCTSLAERNRELAGNFCYEKRAAPYGMRRQRMIPFLAYRIRVEFKSRAGHLTNSGLRYSGLGYL